MGLLERLKGNELPNQDSNLLERLKSRKTDFSAPASAIAPTRFEAPKKPIEKLVEPVTEEPIVKKPISIIDKIKGPRISPKAPLKPKSYLDIQTETRELREKAVRDKEAKKAFDIQAGETRKSITKLLQDTKDTGRTTEQEIELNRLREQLKTSVSGAVATESGFKTGLGESLLFNQALKQTEVSGGVTPEAAQAAREQPGFGTGRVVGEIAKTASQYSVVGKLLAGTKLGATLASKLGTKFVADQAVDLLADRIVQAPNEWLPLIKGEKSWGETGIDIALATGLDVLLNIAVGSVIDSASFKEAISKINILKKSDPSIAKIVEDAIAKSENADIIRKALEVETPKPKIMSPIFEPPKVTSFEEGLKRFGAGTKAPELPLLERLKRMQEPPDIKKELGLPSITKTDFAAKEGKAIADDIELERYYKQFEQPKKELFEPKDYVNKTVDIEGDLYRIVGEEGTNYKAILETGEETLIPKAYMDDVKPKVIERPTDFDRNIIDDATMESIVKSKSIQEMNTELKPFIKNEALLIKNDLQSSVKGERLAKITGEGDVIGTFATKKRVSPTIQEIQDQTNATYREIEESIDRIIKDEGIDTLALDKRIQLIINDNLEKGYKTFVGDQIGPNKNYIDVLNSKAKPDIIKESLPKKIIEAPEIKPIKVKKEAPVIKKSEALPEVKKPKLKAPEKVKPVEVKKEKLKTPTTAAVKIKKTVEPKIEVQMPMKAVGKPIDTKTRVLVEMPKKVKGKISDKVERIYQEVVSTNVPFEKMGGKTKVMAANINRLQGAIEYNVIGKQTDLLGNDIGKGITEIFEDVLTVEKKEFFDYVLNVHNIDRAFENKAVFGKTIDASISKKIVADYNISHPHFAKKQKEITKYYSNLMWEWSVKSGLVSKKTAKMLQARYPDYVPTYRAEDLPSGMTVGNQNVAQMIKTAKGGDKFVLPMDQQMVSMAERTIKNAKRNELMNDIATRFELDPDSVSRYVKRIKKLEPEKINDMLDIGKNFDVEPTIKNHEYVVNFYKDGEPMEMVVNESLFKALENVVSKDSLDAIAGFVKKYATNPFKAVVTGYNPLFSASNIMRDIPTALTYSADPLKMAANAPEAVKEMLTNGDYYRKFKALGGTREGLIGSGKNFKVPTSGEARKAFEIAQKFNPIKGIGDINQFTETLPRFSEFMTVLKETGDPALAIYKSAELTTDFSRHGKLTKYLDNYVPYLNPSVQGIDKFFRSFKDSPLKTAVKGASVITVPTIILDQINKDNEAYNNLSPRERNLYFNVPIPNSEKFLRIPKSRELGVAFSSIYEWAARASRGEKVTGDEIYQAIKENFTPADVTTTILTPALKAWRQITDPDSYQTNYWGSLIVPASQRKYSPGEQYDLNSSGIAKAIGKEFEISPFVVDYLIKSYTGIIGQVIQPIGRDKKQSILAPIETKFITDPVFKSDSVNKFYTLLGESKKAAQDYNRKHDIPSKTVTELEKKANFLNKYSRLLSEKRKLMKKLQVTKGNEDEIRELQKEINRLSVEAVRIVLKGKE